MGISGIRGEISAWSPTQKRNTQANGTDFSNKLDDKMTGMVCQLDNNTTAFIGDNGTAIKGKDGKELFVSTSGMGYDEVMRMFDRMPKTGNFFDSSFWHRQML